MARIDDIEMSRNLRYALPVGVLALLAMIAVVIVWQRDSGYGVLSRKEVEQRITELKGTFQSDIDEKTRNRIEGLINDFAEERRIVDVNGVKMSADKLAGHELQIIGAAAIPQLIDAAGSHESVKIRAMALFFVHVICRRHDIDLSQFLPVHVRSMEDESSRVRSVAIREIGAIVGKYVNPRQEEKIEELIPYLLKGLRDEEQSVRDTAAGVLYKYGETHLVPAEIVNRTGLDKRYIWKNKPRSADE